MQVPTSNRAHTKRPHTPAVSAHGGMSTCKAGAPRDGHVGHGDMGQRWRRRGATRASTRRATARTPVITEVNRRPQRREGPPTVPRSGAAREKTRSSPSSIRFEGGGGRADGNARRDDKLDGRKYDARRPGGAEEADERHCTLDGREVLGRMLRMAGPERKGREEGSPATGIDAQRSFRDGKRWSQVLPVLVEPREATRGSAMTESG